MYPFSFSTSVAEFESRFKIAETKLLEIAQRYSTGPANSLELKAFDTYIPRSAVPCLKPANKDEDNTLKIHCVQAISKEPRNELSGNQTTQMPLVNLHGYLNSGAYFYQNFGGLASYFQNVYAVDMLGCGLSTRPSFDEVNESDTIKSAEDFFVESLEAWRSMNNIDKMILSGHSFGAYVAVAYCERYPERVDRLILLSPFGVPDWEDPNLRLHQLRSSLRGQAFIGIWQTFFYFTTPGGVMRSFTEYRGAMIARNYVERRLPEITDVDEAEALAELLYMNCVLPPSGEFFVKSLFTSNMIAKKPLMFRIPGLKLKSVNFMYGTKDWMDISGGMNSEKLCHRLKQQQDGSSKSLSVSVPDVNVFLVPNAGHLLILQNPKFVSTCMISIAGGKVRDEDMSDLMDLDESEELNESWLIRALEVLEEKPNRVGS